MSLTRRDVFIALSLANLCYLRVWNEILAVSSVNAYFLQISNADVLALVLNVLLLAALFLGATAVARRFGRAGRIAIIAGFVGVLVMQLNALGPDLSPGVFASIDRWKHGQHLEALAPAFVLAIIAAASYRWPRRALGIATGTVLFFAPFVAVTFGRAAWILLTIDPTTALASVLPALGAPVPNTEGPRVVVLVMDAMSRRHAIDARPDFVELPALDQFRAGAIDASQVQQAAAHTLESLPTLLTGLDVEESAPSADDELMLTVDSAQVRFSETENILDEASALGGAAIIAGWYHPYCRLIAVADNCAMYPTRTLGSRARETGFLRAMLDQQVTLVPYIGLRYRQIEVVEEQRADAIAAVTMGQRGLVFLHLGIPHTPWIWDAEAGDYTLTEYDPDGYYGNLALMDRVLGELRAAMERAGKWDNTAVLLLSDHVIHYRPRYLNEPKDTRVPFILKLPGQRNGVAYTRPFNADVTHDLVESLLQGRISTVAQATRWLDRR